MRSWEKLSNPQVLQHNLVVAGLYLVAFELLQASIVDRLSAFFATDVEIAESGRIKGLPSSRYAAAVLSLDPNHPFNASCLWLVNNGVISEGERLQIDAIRQHRNEVAHELPVFVVEADKTIDLGRLERIRHLLLKIERWWVLEVDVPANPGFDGRTIAAEDVRPGPVLFLDFIIQTAAVAAGTARTWRDYEA
jgi:hypothetical protein